MKATTQIFLSYAREDEEQIENLYQKLSDAGFEPWMDKKDILPGEKWKSCIQKAIRHSGFFLVCLSANSIDKRGWIQREIRDALDIWQEMLDSDIYLIPVRLEKCEVPESLRDFQWVDLFEADGWTRLVKAIQVGMERRAEAPTDEERPPSTEMAVSKEGSERERLINDPRYKDIAKAVMAEMAQMSESPTREGEQSRIPVEEKAEEEEEGKVSVVILHLSDIQFGRHHVDKEKRPPLYDGEQAYDDQLTKLKADLNRLEELVGKPDLIVVSGDLAEWGEEAEFQKVEAFLDGVVRHCKLPRSRIVMTPGNHDINRKLCEAARLYAEARHQEFKPPYFPKFEFYQVFFNRFYRSDPRDPDPLNAPELTEELFVVYSYPELGILIAALNSCVQESELEQDHYGLVTVDQVTRAVQCCDEIDPERKMLRIAVMHHNFQRDSKCDNENLQDADDIQDALLEGGFRLLLHGHQHRPKVGVSGYPRFHLYVLATGSAGLDSEVIPDNARRYQVIVIDGENVKIYRRHFNQQESDETGIGCWVSDPVRENLPFACTTGPATMEFSLSLNQ